MASSPADADVPDQPSREGSFGNSLARSQRYPKHFGPIDRFMSFQELNCLRTSRLAGSLRLQAASLQAQVHAAGGQYLKLEGRY